MSYEDALIQSVLKSEKILILVGAGISVNAGIPDFRSPESGIYAKYGLDASDVFHIDSFRDNPIPFYRIITELAFDQHGQERSFIPTVTHNLIGALKKKRKLLRVYSQNIDGLDGSPIGLVSDVDLIQCHGNLDKIVCSNCSKTSILTFGEWKTTVRRFLETSATDNSDDLRKIPRCLICDKCDGFSKPAVILFGESLPSAFFKKIQRDTLECDLLLVIGTSLSVYPFASVPEMVPLCVPKYVISKAFAKSISGTIVVDEECDTVSAKILTSLGLG